MAPVSSLAPAWGLCMSESIRLRWVDPPITVHRVTKGRRGWAHPVGHGSEHACRSWWSLRPRAQQLLNGADVLASIRQVMTKEWRVEGMADCRQHQLAGGRSQFGAAEIAEHMLEIADQGSFGQR